MVGSVFEVRVMEHSKSFGRRHEVDDGEEGLVDITRAKGSGKGGMEVAEEMEEVEEVVEEEDEEEEEVEEAASSSISIEDGIGISGFGAIMHLC